MSAQDQDNAHVEYISGKAVWTEGVHDNNPEAVWNAVGLDSN